MMMRSGIAVGIVCMLLRASATLAEAPATGSAGGVEEARIEVEMLQLELNSEKVQLQQQLRLLQQFEFGFRGGMGMMGGGFGGGGRGGNAVAGPDAEERKKTVASMRESYDELKAATVDTAKRLAEAQRRLAALEGQVEAAGPAGSPPSSGRSSLAERRAALVLFELEYDVDKALLRDALLKLGQAELQQTFIPAAGEVAEDAAKRLDRLRAYAETRKRALLERGIALELKKQELAEIEKRLSKDGGS
jgi:hypothetical protein